MILALLFLFAWPWQHVEKFHVTVGLDGHAVYKFTKPFKAHPACTGNPRAWSKDWVEYVGTPGSTLSESCK